jgi:hypothetical protein
MYILQTAKEVDIPICDSMEEIYSSAKSLFLCSITEWLVLLCRELQYNLIRSHAAGVGTPLNPEKTRMLLALRINVLAKGHSGISLATLYDLIRAFNGTWKYSFWVGLIKMWYSKYQLHFGKVSMFSALSLQHYILL